jgi:hypothetical protein
MCTRGVIVAGALASGALATAIGVRPAFAAGGATEIISALLMARALSTMTTHEQEVPPAP